MNIFTTAAEMRAWSMRQKCAGKRIGFVPTMGALHEGHASLLRAAAQDGIAVLSIFVNPKQFAPHEDLEKYPRTWEADLALAEGTGIRAVYAPSAATMYPAGFATHVEVEGVSEGLCSLTRPHFFRGVATVVTKLFTAVLPDRAYFGQKDAQQCAVIRRMAADLDLGVEIVEMPIVREANGLAMSSRNKYLNDAERESAMGISRGLGHARELLEAGERDAEKITQTVRASLDGLREDYIALVDAETMQPTPKADRPVLLAVAAYAGNTRLIDNLKYSPSAV